MSHRNGANVPKKFGSFKARGIGQARPKVKDELSNVHHDLEDHHTQRENRHFRRDYLDEKVRDRQPLASGNPSLTTTEDIEASESWIIDVRGDPKNVDYGCLHRYDIPQYHRFGQGYVVGAPSNVKIDRFTSTDREIVLYDTRYSQAKRDGLSSKSGNAAKQAEVSMLAEASNEMDEEQDFVDLNLAEAGLLNHEDQNSQIANVGIWKHIHEDG